MQLAASRAGESVLDTVRDGGDLLAVDDTARFDLIVSRLPTSGAVPNSVPKSLRRYGRTGRPELLRLAACLELLRPDGRGVLLVPNSVLTGTSKVHGALRRALVEEHRLDAVIRLPAGWVQPAMSGAAAIVVFSKAQAATSDVVALYDLISSRSAARRRGVWDALPQNFSGYDVQPVLASWLRLAYPASVLAPVVERVVVTKMEIVARDYALGWRKAPAAAAAAPPRAPHAILAELTGLEAEIFQGIRDLVAMIK